MDAAVPRQPSPPRDPALAMTIDAGCRPVDAAAGDGNEKGIGHAGSESGGSVLFVITKLWNSDQDYDHALQEFDASLAMLGVDHADLWRIGTLDGNYGRTGPNPLTTNV